MTKKNRKKSILVLSHPDEYHAKFIYNKLINLGESVYFFDLRDFPTKIQLTYSPSGDYNHRLIIDGEEIFPKSIYWRWYHGSQIKNTKLSSSDRNIAYKDSLAAMKGYLGSLKCKWVNPPSSYYLHWCKPLQMEKFKNAKIPLPKTIITNEKDVIFKFIEKHNVSLIYKPVQGGYHTQLVNLNEINELETALKTSPVTIQEYIEGDDIRVFIVGKDLYSMKIISTETDFREDKNHKTIVVDIPDDIKEMCYKAAKVSKYVFTAIDIKKDKHGNYFFLEANPSPMFIHSEKETGFPITKNLCDLLIKG